MNSSSSLSISISYFLSYENFITREKKKITADVNTKSNLISSIIDCSRNTLSNLSYIKFNFS